MIEVIGTPPDADGAEVTTRQRILDRLGDIFYVNGTYHVGMAELVKYLGVTRRTFYRHFKSKEALILAYLERRDLTTRSHLRAVAEGFFGREAILAIFRDLERRTNAERFRGCAFLVATAENPQSLEILNASTEHKRHVKDFFRSLLGDAQTAETTAEQLLVLYDGALASSLLQQNANAAASAREIVGILFNADCSVATD